MLTQEQIKALNESRESHARGEIRRVKAVAELPEALRPIAYGLLFRDMDGRQISTQNGADYQRRFAVHQQALTQLDALSAAERIALFAAFFPGLASAIELGWQYLKRAPYDHKRYADQGGRFFRAPTRSDITLTGRGDWLTGLMPKIGPADDLVWLAQRAAYLDNYNNELGLLFAAIIEGDAERGPAVFAALARTARGEDEIGTFSRHIPVALLAASRPDGWEIVARLLLSAQREEGVRQVILDALDTAHPGAWRHILGVIRAENLVRFSAVTYIVNGWLGAAFDSAQAPRVNRILGELDSLRSDANARAAALESGDAEATAFALWATASEDIYAALPLAEALLSDADVGRRYAAARLLTQSSVPEALPLLARALNDPDLRVVAQAYTGLSRDSGHTNYGNRAQNNPPDPNDFAIFAQIEALLARLGRRATPAEPAPLLWGAPIPPLNREQVADLLLSYLGDRYPQQLIAHLGDMSQYGRSQVAIRLGEHDLTDPVTRATLFALLRDRASLPRQQAHNQLAKTTITAQEAPTIEALLDSGVTETRQSAVQLLLRQPGDNAIVSVERLLVATKERLRLGGLEMLRQLYQTNRAPEACLALAAAYRQRRATLTAPEEALLSPVRANAEAAPTLDDALGLAQSDRRAPILDPKPCPRAWTSPAAIAALLSLDGLIYEHRTDSYTYEDHAGGRHEALLGDSYTWQFPMPKGSQPIAEDVARLPFADLWRGWAEARPAEMRDTDGFEWLRMLIQLSRRSADETRSILAEQGVVVGDSEGPASRLTLLFPDLLGKILYWLMRLYPLTGGADFLLDQLETELTQIPERELRPPDDPTRVRYRQYQKLDRAVSLARFYRAQCPDDWTNAHDARLWRLLRYSQTLPQPHLSYSPTLEETLAAHRAGVATEVDLIYQFLGPREQRAYGRAIFAELSTLSTRKPPALLSEYPVAGAIYARCMRRVLEVELQRGETPTIATDAALCLRSLSGANIFFVILRALGEERLARGYNYGSRTKTYTFSYLLRATFPAADDTPDAFRARAQAFAIPQRRLVEAAVYAPQWARHIEAALGWEGLAEGVWWTHAHTKDSQWSVDQAIREEWVAAIGAWTPITGDDLYDGAVDVAWFQRMLATLGEERWKILYESALYASGGTGHTRARLYADALLGRADEAALLERIHAKRNRDAASALGLLPLPKATSARRKTILARYQALQEFIRSAQKFGAQRREGDQKAARIGLDNLARTAGYADPTRFQWAMELDEVADLAVGPLHVTHDTATLTLDVDTLGQPRLIVEKAGKPLKEIPPRLKKEPGVIALRERKQRLEQQATRMRGQLEQAMLHEDIFTASELAALLRHPLLAPMLEQLVFVGPNALGYPINAATALRTPQGDIAIAPDATLRIAHAHDLYASGEWSAYQRECFTAERIQPFKQVFRELYPLTAAERQAGARSLRYAGHQIQPQQAMALLAARGWLTNAQESDVTRTFHERNITASVDFLYGGGTAADVDGLTLEGVSFHHARDNWGRPLALTDISPIVFSEVMRDLDLVVSVAHRGGIDPESSASSVETRAALARETCAALGLKNVELKSAHAIITGKLGEYSIHLGSGVVHRLPGGAICIIPVGSQQRGRLFLPFADDDPKTAEVVSKIILLARDSEIKDPLILDQLLARV